MMFDLPESLDVSESLISRLQDDHDINISVKPKARQTNKSCIIKAQERNSGGMYLARHLMLQLDKQDEVIVRAEVPETYKVMLCNVLVHYVHKLGLILAIFLHLSIATSGATVWL